MANIKNFGIVGVGAGVQFGKGGAQLIQTSGTFAARNATANALVAFQHADGVGASDGATFGQLTNAVSTLDSAIANVATEVDAVELGAGLNNDGTYTAPTNTSYLTGATSLKAADVLLDSAILAEVTRATGAEGVLTNAVAAANTAAAAAQAELDLVEHSVGLGTDGSLTLAAGHYLGTATDLVTAIEILDSELGNTATLAANTAAQVATILTSDNNFQSEIDNTNSNVSTLSGRVDSDEAVAAALANTVADNYTTLNTAIDTENTRALAAEAALANAGSNAVLIEAARAEQAESDLENAIVSNAAAANSALQAEVTRATAAEGVLTSDLANTDANAVTLTARVAGDEATAAALANTVAAETTARIAGDLNNANAIAQEVSDRANAVSTEAAARIAGDLDNANAVAGANAAIAAEVTRATAAEGVLTGAVTAANAAVAAEAVTARAAEAALTTNVALIQGSYVNKDGSVAMTGALDLGNNAIHNVATGVDSTDAVNVGQLTAAIGALGNAFDYKGTLTPGSTSGTATVLPTGAHAGDYYKALSDGYFTDGTDTFEVFKNDGVVYNTTGGWDTIAHTESTVNGTAGIIDVTGSVDTGFTVTIDGAYTAAAAQAVSDEANSRIAADATNATAIMAEATRATAAEMALGNSVAAANAAVAQEASDRANAVSSEATARIAGDLTNANAIAQEASDRANAVSAEATLRIAGDLNNANAIAQEVSDRANAVTGVTNAIANTDANAVTLTARVAGDEATAAALANTVSGNYTTLNSAITAETVRAEAAEAALANAGSNAVAIETARAEQAESDLGNAITLTNSNAVTSYTTLNSAINAETLRATTIEDGIVSDLANTDANVATLANTVAALANTETNAIGVEANARIAADTLINSNVALVNAAVVSAQAEIDAIETGAGLNINGTYTANAGSHYIGNAISLANADSLLDIAIANVATALSTLSQDTIKTADSLNFVHVGNDFVSTAMNVGGVAQQVANTIAGSATDSVLTTNYSTAGEVQLVASSPTAANVDLRLAAQGTGHVVIGETGVGVIESDDGYDMTVAAGSGATLHLLGTTVQIGEADGTPVASFVGTAGATAYALVNNGNTSVSYGVTGTASNLDLVFAPKGTGVVNMSSARVIGVANATTDDGAVNLAQLDAAVSTASLGVVNTVTCTLPATSGSVTLGTITGTVLRVKVLVNNAYDANSTITVGNSGTANDLSASTDVDESAVGIYLIETAKDYSAQTVTATVTNATGSNGSAKVIVEYLTA